MSSNFFTIRYPLTLKNLHSSFLICGIFLVLSTFTFAQKIAILTPEKSPQTTEISEKLAGSLSRNFDIVNSSLAESIFEINKPQTPFNLTNQDAKHLGVRIGCNFFILMKTATLRRSTFARNEFYESNAVLYLVSSRTGRLVYWTIQKFDEDTPKRSRSRLLDSIDSLTDKVSKEIKATIRKELTEKPQDISEFPDADSPEAKGLRPPLPYIRLKPKYTALASLYSLVATIDVLVDIDEDGNVRKTEVVRWAGYGLEESVINNVKKMNWRPADRDGKKLPMRILLRYNFKNIETED